MKNKSRGLGKGLSALLNDSYSQTQPDKAEMGAARSESAPGLLPVGKLQPSRYQPRRHFDEQALKELAASIEKNGIMQPILVRSVEGGAYEIIAGERRWRAAQLARLDMVPVLVRELSDRQALELAIVENVQRQDLTPLDEATGYQRLMDEFGYTQEKVAGTVGKSRSHVANLLRLLALPESVKAYLSDGRLSAGHARALVGAEDAASLADKIVKEGLSVRQAEELAKGGTLDAPAKGRGQGRGPSRAAGPRSKDEDIFALEEMLSANLGLTVRISDRGQSGDIVITYQTLTELDGILRRLGGNI